MRKKKKGRQTRHVLNRMETRVSVGSEKIATNMILNAKRLGASPANFPDGELKYYLYQKSWCKKVKVYKGYIFIFNKNSNRAITVYPVPERFRAELNATDLDKAK